VRYPKLSCSFCGRDETKVSRLVAGGSAHMCDGCIAECVAVLEKQDNFRRQSRFRQTGSDSVKLGEYAPDR
jgi:ATP-dependent Clp protease ATP-binding subunit ClpX